MMVGSLEPKVTFRQEPPVTFGLAYDLAMNGDRHFKEAKSTFAQRFAEVCDDLKIPPDGQGRQKAAGALFRVSQKGARKWLKGEGLPELEKCIEIAEKGGVALEWLLTNRGPKKPDNLIDYDVIRLARRISEMPEQRREILMQIFSGEGPL